MQVMNDSLIASLELVKFAEQRADKNLVIAGHLANLTVTRLESLIGLIDVIYGDYRHIMQDVEVR